MAWSSSAFSYASSFPLWLRVCLCVLCDNRQCCSAVLEWFILIRGGRRDTREREGEKERCEVCFAPNARRYAQTCLLFCVRSTVCHRWQWGTVQQPSVACNNNKNRQQTRKNNCSNEIHFLCNIFDTADCTAHCTVHTACECGLWYFSSVVWRDIAVLCVHHIHTFTRFPYKKSTMQYTQMLQPTHK